MSPSEELKDIFNNDVSLELFLASMLEFNQAFCDHMAAGDDFTLKLEVHGNRSELVHVRVLSDGFKRPPGVEKRIEKKGRRGK